MTVPHWPRQKAIVAFAVVLAVTGATGASPLPNDGGPAPEAVCAAVRSGDVPADGFSF